MCNLLPNAKFAMCGIVVDELAAYVEGTRAVRHWLPPSAQDYGGATGRMFRLLAAARV